jgi:L-asparaginase
MRTRGHVHVLFTGGTISMRIDPGTGAAVPALSGSEIVARVQGLRGEARLKLEDYARLPGPHVTPDWMWRLRGRVAAILKGPAVDGVVVTHGTDTLEETAFLLDLTLRGDKPVVFCGAMRTVSEPGWDGPANLMAAVRTAVDPESRGRGVLIAVGEEIHSATEATKWHTQSLHAFRGPYGPLAMVDRGQIVYHRAPFRAPTLATRRLVGPVDLHTMATGVDDALIRASLARGARGLVIEATGCGNVPPTALPGLRAAIAARIPVVLTSRCPEGPVTPAYGYEGGGQKLRKLGVIFASQLPGPKARLKLMAALGQSSDPAEIRALFEAPQAAANGR